NPSAHADPSRSVPQRHLHWAGIQRWVRHCAGASRSIRRAAERGAAAADAGQRAPFAIHHELCQAAAGVRSDLGPERTGRYRERRHPGQPGLRGLTSLRAEPGRVMRSRRLVMGMPVTVELGAEGKPAAAVMEQVFEWFEKVDRLFSTYQPE